MHEQSPPLRPDQSNQPPELETTPITIDTTIEWQNLVAVHQAHDLGESALSGTVDGAQALEQQVEADSEALADTEGKQRIEERRFIHDIASDLYDKTLTEETFVTKYGADRPTVEIDLQAYNKQLETTVLAEEFLAINPKAEVVDGDRGIYAITTEGGKKIYGSVYSIIDGHKDLDRMQVTVDAIRSGGASTMGIKSAEGVGYRSVVVASGSFAQREINPYPADMDFAEHLDIDAENMELAAATLAELLVNTVERSQDTPDMVFTEMKAGIYPSDAPESLRGKAVKWSIADIKAGKKVVADRETGFEYAIDLAQACENPGMVKMDWLTIADGEVKELTKVINVKVSSSDGQVLFTNRQESSAFQEIYFDDISGLGLTESLRQPRVAKEYTEFLLHDIKKYSHPNHANYLKVAKRAYNLLKVSGDVSGARSLAPLFNSTTGELAARSESLSLLPDYMDALDKTGSAVDSATFEDSFQKIASLSEGDPSLFSPSEAAVIRNSLAEVSTLLSTDLQAARGVIDKLAEVFTGKVNSRAQEFLQQNAHYLALIEQGI